MPAKQTDTDHTGSDDMGMAVAKAIGVALVSMALAGCQNMVASSGVYYNVGLADASNSLLLANIIRSAKGYPNYHTLIGDYSGSTSVGSSPSVSASIPSLGLLDQTSFDVGLAPSASVDRNANVSSLETREFTQAMHTQVTPQLLSFLIESHDGTHVHLALAMLTKSVVLTLNDYDAVIWNARQDCEQRFQTLSSARKGICQNFEALLAEITCDLAQDVTGSGPALVTLNNDPTNRCAYSQYRAFVEAVMLDGGVIEIGDDGKLDVMLTPIGAKPRSLFIVEGTGTTLRSPAGILAFLGEIVRDQFSREDGWTPTLTTRNGQNGAIFKVETGPTGGRAAISVKVDGRQYWIRSQELGAQENDFSYRSLTIVKDFLALNTAQDQLPSSPAIILGPGSSTR